MFSLTVWIFLGVCLLAFLYLRPKKRGIDLPGNLKPKQLFRNPGNHFNLFLFYFCIRAMEGSNIWKLVPNGWGVLENVGEME